MDELEQRISASLEAYWVSKTLESNGTGTIDDLVAAMDSFTAVEALLDVEEIVGIELPAGEVIRRGGYDTKDQFVSDLTHKVIVYVMANRK